MGISDMACFLTGSEDHSKQITKRDFGQGCATPPRDPIGFDNSGFGRRDRGHDLSPECGKVDGRGKPDDQVAGSGKSNSQSESGSQLSVGRNKPRWFNASELTAQAK